MNKQIEEIPKTADERVAEIVEPKPELPNEEEAGEMLMEYLSGTHFYSPGKAWEIAFIYEHGDVAELLPLPFITEPTHATDGIVLEWVQERHGEMINAFEEKVQDIIAKVAGQHYAGFYYFIQFYKPGDYALALLEA